MPSNRNYIKQYQKWIEDYEKGNGFKKGKFYLISEYISVDGEKKKYSFYESPIIFTLFVSDKQDLIHCLKVTDINPNLLKKFFDKLIDVEKEKIVVAGGARQFYNKHLMNIPSINDKIYRTYKISGMKKYFDLDMNVTKLITKISNKDTYKTKIKEIEVQRDKE
jgi:hypothetical protein